MPKEANDKINITDLKATLRRARAEINSGGLDRGSALAQLAQAEAAVGILEIDSEIRDHLSSLVSSDDKNTETLTREDVRDIALAVIQQMGQHITYTLEQNHNRLDPDLRSGLYLIENAIDDVGHCRNQ